MGSPKKVAVNVYIENDPTKFPPEPPYKYSMGTDDSKVGKKQCEKLTFDNAGKYDGFDITFTLVDKTGKGFRFMDAGKLATGAQDPDLAPMWVKEVNHLDDPCPDREFWPQFETQKVTSNNMKLEVHNKNDFKQLFKYAFMFSRTPQKGPYEIMYDPGGANQNGPRPLVKGKLIAVALAVSVLALAAYAAFR